MGAPLRSIGLFFGLGRKGKWEAHQCFYGTCNLIWLPKSAYHFGQKHLLFCLHESLWASFLQTWKKIF
jgi:hypothetical protein